MTALQLVRFRHFMCTHLLSKGAQLSASYTIHPALL